jgi:hypothetical protein
MSGLHAGQSVITLILWSLRHFIVDFAWWHVALSCINRQLPFEWSLSIYERRLVDRTSWYVTLLRVFPLGMITFGQHMHRWNRAKPSGLYYFALEVIGSQDALRRMHFQGGQIWDKSGFRQTTILFQNGIMFVDMSCCPFSSPGFVGMHVNTSFERSFLSVCVCIVRKVVVRMKGVMKFGNSKQHVFHSLT